MLRKCWGSLMSTQAHSVHAGNGSTTNISRLESHSNPHRDAEAINGYVHDFDTTSSSWHGLVITRTSTTTVWREPVRSNLSSDHGASSIATSTSRDEGAPVLSEITSSSHKSRTSSSDVWRGPSLSRATSTASSSTADSSQTRSEESVSSTFSSVSSVEETASSTKTGAGPVETDPQQDGSSDEQDRLSNGATAGIVIASMLVLLGLILLGRYLYKKRRRENQSRWQDDSSGTGPYGSDPRHDPPAPRASVFEHSEPSQLNSWLAHHRPSRNRASRSWSGSPSPMSGQPGNVELRCFTRPARPKLFEVGNPVSPQTSGEPSNARSYADPGPQPYRHPDGEGGARDQEMPAAPLRGGSRVAVLPWEEGPRPDRWAAW